MVVQRSGSVCADTEIDGMAEGKLAGEAHQDIPCLTRVSEE